MSTCLMIMMVINIIAAIVLSIILTGMEVLNLCGYDLPCVRGDGKEERDKIRKVRKYLKYGMKFV